MHHPRRTLACLATIVATSLGCSSEAPTPAPVVPIAPVAGPEPSAAPFPDEVSDLGAVMPAESAFVLELPDASRIADVVPAEQRALVATLRPFLEGGAADKLGIDSRVLHDLVDAFERAAAFGDLKDVAVVARFKAREPVDKLVASMKAVPKETVPGVRAAFSPPGSDLQRLVWFAKPRLLVWATSAAAAERVDVVATGRADSFAKHPRRLPPDPAALRFYADLGALAVREAEAKGLVDKGSSLRAELTYKDGGLRSKLELGLVGQRLPRVAAVLDRNAPALTARFPEETAVLASLSLARQPGKTVRDVVTELARPAGGTGGGAAVADVIDGQLKKKLGFGLDDLEAVLGGELSVGAATAPNAHLDTNDPGKTRLDDVVLIAAAASKDDARAKRLADAVAKLVAKDPTLAKRYKVSTTNGLRLTPTKAGEASLRFEAHKGALVFEAGGATWMDRFAKAFDGGERPLGAAPAYKSVAPAIAKPANGVLWVDLDRASKVFGKGGAAPGGKSGVARAFFGAPSGGLDLIVEGENGAEAFAIGTLAAVGIYGVRRYLASAKVAEAKNVVGAISRAAVMAFEREQGPNNVVHQLCKSAVPVPSAVPAGAKYQPSAAAGRDFESGDDQTGWRCLHFAMSEPHYFQYEYRRGGPYKGPKRGGPDPGPDGFEVSAEGDLDGNGKTSLFTRIGKVDKAKQTVKLSTELFVSDEFE